MNTRNRKKLEEHFKMRHKNVAKFLNRVTHHFRNDVTESIRNKGYKNLRMGHASLLYNIGLDGINVNQLAKRAFMTKQAMSKLVKELMHEGYIESQQHETDKRSFNVFITDKGANLMFEMDKCVQDIQQRYIEILGERNFKIMIDSLGKILDDYQKEI